MAKYRFDPSDPQKHLVYEADDEWGNFGYFAGVGAAQFWLDHIVERRFWRRYKTVRHVRIRYPVTGKCGAHKLDDRNGRIDVRAPRLCEGVLCHELAHFPSWTDGTRDHRREFCAFYLDIVAHVMGHDTAIILSGIWDRLEVKY
jgi:hypothetical protein